MDLYSSINWARRFHDVISKDTNIPTDIIFQIVDGDEVKDMKAHKMILGMVSPVFLNMFYVVHTDDRTAKTIIIQQTSAPAFQIMLDVIYFVKSIENSLRGKTVDEIFAVLDVVTRYQIPELVDVNKYLTSLQLPESTVEEAISDAVAYLPTFEDTAHSFILHCVNFTESVDVVMTALDMVSDYESLTTQVLERLASMMLSNDNVMKVASKAVDFQPNYEENSQDLLFNCAKYLRPQFTDAKSVFRFTAENKEYINAVIKLQELMVDIPEKCDNCREENCSNGMEVKRSKLRKGLVVLNKDTKLTNKVIDFSNEGFLDYIKLEKNENGETYFYNSSRFPKLVFRCVR